MLRFVAAPEMKFLLPPPHTLKNAALFMNAVQKTSLIFPPQARATRVVE
jgi:hypothetical protein